MYLLIGTSHNTFIHCHGNYMEVKKRHVEKLPVTYSAQVVVFPTYTGMSQFIIYRAEKVMINKIANTLITGLL